MCRVVVPQTLCMIYRSHETSIAQYTNYHNKILLFSRRPTILDQDTDTLVCCRSNDLDLMILIYETDIDNILTYHLLTTNKLRRSRLSTVAASQTERCH